MSLARQSASPVPAPAGADTPVIPSQPAGWRGNPFPSAFRTAPLLSLQPAPLLSLEPPPIFTSLRASDRCHWRGNPRPPSPRRRRGHPVIPSQPPILLSLRTSDRCHWCGNPFPFSLRTAIVLSFRASPQTGVGIRFPPRFGLPRCCHCNPPHCCHWNRPQYLRHCEPVTDVTGSAIRPPSPRRRRGHPVIASQ